MTHGTPMGWTPQIYIGTKKLRECEKKNTQDVDIWTIGIACDASLSSLGSE